MEEIMAANSAEEEVTEKLSRGDGDAAVAPAPTRADDSPDGETNEEPLTKTQAFSRRLNAMTAKAVDDFVASLGLTDENGSAIETRAAFDAYRAAQERETAGAPAPEAAEELSRVKEALAAANLREQDEALLRSPALGAAYRQVRGEVLSLVGRCRREGADVDVRAAFSSLLERDAEEIFRNVRADAAAEAVRGADALRRASAGRLGGGDVPDAPDWGSMSDAEFERQLALAKNGGLRRG